MVENLILSLEMNILQEPLPQEIMHEILEFGRILQLYTHFVCSMPKSRQIELRS